MKRMLLAVLALAAALTAWGQEFSIPRREDPRKAMLPKFEYPDSMTQMYFWQPDISVLYPLPTDLPQKNFKKRDAERTPEILVPMKPATQRTRVSGSNVLQIGPFVTLSNGQAWNWHPSPEFFLGPERRPVWGSFIGSYLDARTLSFPMPR
ncbi:hypothetical protein [uncultured Alistipes sp.]|uniref:hypothetical protein n=1 Tax=uncultured Alistipes sp. TaxID=538949 RepID=UPI001F8CC7C9|nr:hypothetical protein [uncultured Alistipes sp.]HJC26346.1 hypothetical protein [Candidatus Alistipes stercoravium]